MLAFGLIYREKGQANEKLLAFMMDAGDMCKSDMLTELCKNIANAVCRTDFVRVFLNILFCLIFFHLRQLLHYYPYLALHNLYLALWFMITHRLYSHMIILEYR